MHLLTSKSCVAKYRRCDLSFENGLEAISILLLNASPKNVHKNVNMEGPS